MEHSITSVRLIPKDLLNVEAGSLHDHRNHLASCKDEAEVSDYLSAQLRKSLTPVCSPFCKMDKEDFWDWYKRTCPTRLSLDEDYIVGYVSDRAEREKQLMALRHEETKNRDFFFHVADYMARKNDTHFVLVLDNGDPLPLDTLVATIWFTEEFKSRFPFTEVLALRDVSVPKLKRETSFALHDPNVEWNSCPTAEILKARLEPWKGETCRDRARELKIGTKRILFSDVSWLVNNMVDAVLSDKMVEVISHLSGGNIRSKFFLTRQLMSSGLIPESITLTTVANQRKPIPLWSDSTTLSTCTRISVAQYVCSRFWEA